MKDETFEKKLRNVRKSFKVAAILICILFAALIALSIKCFIINNYNLNDLRFVIPALILFLLLGILGAISFVDGLLEFSRIHDEIFGEGFIFESEKERENFQFRS